VRTRITWPKRLIFGFERKPKKKKNGKKRGFYVTVGRQKKKATRLGGPPNGEKGPTGQPNGTKWKEKGGKLGDSRAVNVRVGGRGGGVGANLQGRKSLVGGGKVTVEKQKHW